MQNKAAKVCITSMGYASGIQNVVAGKLFVHSIRGFEGGDLTELNWNILSSLYKNVVMQMIGPYFGWGVFKEGCFKPVHLLTLFVGPSGLYAEAMTTPCKWRLPGD